MDKFENRWITHVFKAQILGVDRLKLLSPGKRILVRCTSPQLFHLS